jgi:hypothetical protein
VSPVCKLAGLLCLLIKLTFFPLCLLAGESKVNSLYSSIKPGRSSTPYLSLTSREANLSAKTYSFLAVGHQGTWRTKASIYCGTCILSHTQTEPLNSPLKSGHFLSEVGWQSFERLTLRLPLHLMNSKPYSFSSKPCSHYLWNSIEARGQTLLPEWLTPKKLFRSN